MNGQYQIKVIGFGSPPMLQCFVCSQPLTLIKSLHLELVTGDSGIARLACSLFNQGAYPDYDEKHPKVSIIKVTCCGKHVANLEHLRKLLEQDSTLKKDLIEQARYIT